MQINDMDAPYCECCGEALATKQTAECAACDDCYAREAAESRIEQQVEMRINVLDRAFLNGRMTRLVYAAEIKEVDRWAERQYNLLPQAK